MRHLSRVLLAAVIVTTLAFGGRTVLARRTQVEPPPDATVTLLPNDQRLYSGGSTADGPVQTVMVLDTHSGVLTALSVHLLIPRIGHTATVLPDGNVIVIGGKDQQGRPVSRAEILDLQSGSSVLAPVALAVPRAWHSTSVLEDGTLLVVGGEDGLGNILSSAEVWDLGAGTATVLASNLAHARSAQTATMTSDDQIRFSGGTTFPGSTNGDEIFDPTTSSFLAAAGPADVSGATFLVASSPVDGATDAGSAGPIVLRFSQPVLLSSANTDTIVLRDADGAIAATVVPVEDGRLVFVTPTRPLSAGGHFTVSLIGVEDAQQAALRDAEIGFTTRATGAPATAGADGDSWIPAAGTAWNTGRGKSPWEDRPPLMAAPGVTAVSGRVLRLSGLPLTGVTLSIGGVAGDTDESGRFLLEFVPSGHQVLRIDGRSAGQPHKNYGLFEAGIDVTPAQTNVLPFTSWLPLIDAKHAITISSPTSQATVVTTPVIPGLEVHIPAGTVVRDVNDAAVTEVGITAIPIDRPPFPLPTNVYVPIYFTVQPGGAELEAADGTPSGARVYYPNYRAERAGTRFDFWHYDPEGKGWYVYGGGAVNAQATQIVPDPGISVYEFTGAMVANPAFAPGVGPAPGNAPADGEPVDLGTGLFVLNATDLSLPDTLPVGVFRSYRPGDSRSRAFGLGSNHSYDMFVVGDSTNYTYQDLILADGTHIHFRRTSPGTTGITAQYVHDSAPDAFFDAKIRYDSQSDSWFMTLKDGTQMVFPDGQFATTPTQGALTGVTDRYGNTVTLTRDTANRSRLTRISGPDGAHTIDFTYDTSDRITQARDNTGRTVGYQYDTSGRLWKVTDIAGSVTTYGYDTSGRMLTVTNARGITTVSNTYDANGRVTQQVLGDGGVYHFAYTLNGSQVTQTDVTDPRGYVRRVTFNAAGLWLTDTRALGQPEQEVLSVVRDPTTNLVQSFTDGLNRVTAYTYDTLGDPLTITRLSGTPDAVTHTFGYYTTTSVSLDRADLTSIQDPLGHTTSFDYDGFRILKTVTDPLGHVLTLTTSGAGVPMASTNAAGTTQYGFSGGVMSMVADPLGHGVQRVIDGAGRAVLQVDPRGLSTGVEYNQRSQPTGIVDPLGGRTTFAYDAVGNLQSIADARQSTTSYTYDALDRVLTVTDPLFRQSTFTYDLSGNVATITDRKGQVTRYAYDALNRCVSATYADGSTTAYVYDAGDRLEQVSDSLGGTIAFTYDGIDNMLSETNSLGSVAYTYDAAGNRLTMTVSGQPAVSYVYDNDDRLTSITRDTTTVIFGYDDAHRRTSAVLPNGVTAAYVYDAASRLTGITFTNGTQTLGTLTYDYDASGQRLQVGGTLARTNLPAALSTATYDAANQLQTWDGATFTYDAEGHLASRSSGATFGWDARGRLEAIGGTIATSLAYDGLNRRTSQIDALGDATSELHDGDRSVQELVNGMPVANLLMVPDADELLARFDAQGTHTALTDALASVIALSDPSGAMTTSYTYDPFGATSATGAATTNTRAFAGGELDATGTYYNRARYLDPATGRFLSQDPLQFVGGDFNLYTYARDNPTTFVDPNGQQGLVPLVVGAGGAIFGMIGEGGKGYQCKDSAMKLAADIGRGAVSGALGAYAGLWITENTGSPAAAGMAASIVGDSVDVGLGGHVGMADFAKDTLIGAGVGLIGDGLTQTIFSVNGGSNFNPLRSARTWGPRAQQLYAGEVTNHALDVVTHPQRNCDCK